MHEATIRMWALALAFMVGYGAHALIQDGLRYLETFKK